MQNGNHDTPLAFVHRSFPGSDEDEGAARRIGIIPSPVSPYKNATAIQHGSVSVQADVVLHSTSADETAAPPRPDASPGASFSSQGIGRTWSFGGSRHSEVCREDSGRYGREESSRGEAAADERSIAAHILDRAQLLDREHSGGLSTGGTPSVGMSVARSRSRTKNYDAKRRHSVFHGQRLAFPLNRVTGQDTVVVGQHSASFSQGSQGPQTYNRHLAGSDDNHTKPGSNLVSLQRVASRRHDRAIAHMDLVEMEGDREIEDLLRSNLCWYLLKSGWILILAVIDLVFAIILHLFWLQGNFLCYEDDAQTLRVNVLYTILLSLFAALHFLYLVLCMRQRDAEGKRAGLRVFYSTTVDTLPQVISNSSYLVSVLFSSLVFILDCQMCTVDDSDAYLLIKRLHTVGQLWRCLQTFHHSAQISVRTRKRVQTAVSQNKRRFIDPVNKFDLDLTYVCDRIIIKSIPCVVGAFYRNNIHEVARFFATRHYGSFLIFNFCQPHEERGNGNYDTSLLYDQVVKMRVRDHNCPTVQQLISFCRHAVRFLDEHPSHVVAMHCLGGKGRSGTFCCALLLWTGFATTVESALLYYANRRTGTLEGYSKKQGVTAPCQMRSLNYLRQVIYSGLDWLEPRPMLLRKIRIRAFPTPGRRGGIKYGMLVESRGHVAYDHVKAVGVSSYKSDLLERCEVDVELVLLQDDVFIRFFEFGEDAAEGDCKGVTGDLDANSGTVHYGTEVGRQLFFVYMHTSFAGRDEESEDKSNTSQESAEDGVALSLAESLEERSSERNTPRESRQNGHTNTNNIIDPELEPSAASRRKPRSGDPLSEETDARINGRRAQGEGEGELWVSMGRDEVDGPNRARPGTFAESFSVDCLLIDAHAVVAVPRPRPPPSRPARTNSFPAAMHSAAGQAALSLSIDSSPLPRSSSPAPGNRANASPPPFGRASLPWALAPSASGRQPSWKSGLGDLGSLRSGGRWPWSGVSTARPWAEGTQAREVRGWVGEPAVHMLRLRKRVKSVLLEEGAEVKAMRHGETAFLQTVRGRGRLGGLVVVKGRGFLFLASEGSHASSKKWPGRVSRPDGAMLEEGDVLVNHPALVQQDKEVLLQAESDLVFYTMQAKPGSDGAGVWELEDDMDREGVRDLREYVLWSQVSRAARVAQNLRDVVLESKVKRTAARTTEGVKQKVVDKMQKRLNIPLLNEGIIVHECELRFRGRTEGQGHLVVFADRLCFTGFTKYGLPCRDVQLPFRDVASIAEVGHVFGLSEHRAHPASGRPSSNDVDEESADGTAQAFAGSGTLRPASTALHHRTAHSHHSAASSQQPASERRGGQGWALVTKPAQGTESRRLREYTWVFVMSSQQACREAASVLRGLMAEYAEVQDQDQHDEGDVWKGEDDRLLSMLGLMSLSTPLPAPVQQDLLGFLSPLQVRSFPAGSVVADWAGKSGVLLHILEGKVSMRDSEGKVLHRRFQGDVVGELSVFCTDNRGMEATAVAEGEVKAILVPMESVVELGRKAPIAAAHVYRSYSASVAKHLYRSLFALLRATDGA